MSPVRFISHVPDYIRKLVPYVPGKPIEETQREYKIRRVIKLASNENPWGPSPKAIAAARKAIAETNRYPDASGYALKQALSRDLKVKPESLILGNGSNDVIDLLVRTYCVPGDSIVTSQAAFIAYKICAQVHGVTTVESRLTPDMRFDLDAMLKLIRADEKVRIVFIANPNNPTGTYVPEKELIPFLDAVSEVHGGGVLVVLDYAYWEFVTAKDLPDPMKIQERYPNVIVLRTFSKVHGLAGFRLGYGVGAPEVISHLEKVRQPFNLNLPAMAAAVASLGDKARVKKVIAGNRKGMKFWEKELAKLKIPYWKSQGNFLLVDVKRGLGRTGGEVYQECLRKGVIFRPVTNYGLPDALRISVGTDEENRIAIRVLKELAGKR